MKKNKNLIFIIILIILLLVIIIFFLNKFTGYVINQNVKSDFKVNVNRKCIENDGGVNFYVKGLCRDNKQVLTDTCFNSRGVIEYYCNSNKDSCIYMIASCPYGCEDGACKKRNY